jgi:acetoin utilization deacetylase AcuC-like enzyme
VNYPLPPRTGETEFLRALDDALGKIADAKPSLLAVSAGFDAFKGDPITEMGLEVETFGKIGEHIAAARLPTFAVLEGGYSPQLGQCIESFLLGWALQ